MGYDRRAKVAAELRAEIARQQLTQSAVAAATGIKSSTLGRRLNGREPFYLHELEAICSFLDMPLSEFLERTQDAA